MNKIESGQFIANVGLKDIVGRGLITNTNIALIELIKNAKDAASNSVHLIFENTDNIESPDAKIIIKDFGIGMTYDDLVHKWLNMAYSSKKNKLDSFGRAYAGNKGIGRFSCDRLGKILDMYTIAQNNQGYRLHINWEEFEVDDPNKTISDPKVDIYTLEQQEINKIFGVDNITHGTCLIISNLRFFWNYDELHNLKRELEKFVITPTSEIDEGKFNVYIKAEFLKNKENFDEINTKIENKIFHDLDFRTASICSEISPDGKFITTSLSHNAKNIFTTFEKNIYPKLKNIKIRLFHMGRAQKVFLARRIGYEYRTHNDFGSIFLFLNGFRIYPYGEEGNDWLRIDKRKAQGYSRYLGTRDLLGYISINDSENIFNPISAREGLENNEAFMQLAELDKRPTFDEYGYVSKIFRKLEKFVVDGLKWDNPENRFTQKDLENLQEDQIVFNDTDKDVLEYLPTLIEYGIRKENFIKATLNKEYLVDMADKEAEAIKILHANVLSLLGKDAIDNIADFTNLMPQIQDKINELQAAKEAAEKRAKKAEQAKKKAEQRAVEAENKVNEQQQTIEQIETENLFHKANASQDTKALRNLIHKIVIDANGIKSKIYAYRYKKNDDSLNDTNIEEYFKSISYLTDSILKVAELARSRNYKMKTGLVNVEFFSLVKNYLELLTETKIFDEIKIIDNIPSNINVNKEIKPLEIFIVIDNLINNSIKSNAPEIVFSIIKNDKNGISLNIIDNGDGIKLGTDKTRLFERGYTTTSGAGLGLHYVKEIVEKLGWSIKIIETPVKGFGLEVTIE